MEKYLQKVVTDLKLDGSYMISCKENIGVQEPYNKLIELLQKTDNLYQDNSSILLSGSYNGRPSSNRLDQTPSTKGGKKNCAC